MTGDVARAAWNFTYDKGLVEILHEYKDNPKCKGQNGWVSEGWRVITAKFNETFCTAHFTKQQIQEKEKELKANYKAIRDAKGTSGSGWNESLCMLNVEPHIWEKLIKNHPRVAKFRKKPFPLFYQLEALYEGSVATGNLNFTSAQQVNPPSAPAPAPITLVPVERSNFEQSIHNDQSHFGTNPFASSFDGQETSSAHNEHNETQSAQSNQDSKQGEGASGRKRKQSHIGSAIEDYVDFKKSQTSKTLEALEEKKRRDEEISVQKCIDKMDAMNELTDDEKSYALDLFESEINREMFMMTTNHNVRLLWLKRKIRVLSGSNA